MVLGALELLFEVEKGGGGPFWEFNPLFIFYLIYTFFRPICVPNQPKNAPGPYGLRTFNSFVRLSRPHGLTIYSKQSLSVI